jgi:hypothetical protein
MANGISGTASRTSDDHGATWAVRSAEGLSPVFFDAARFCGGRLGADRAGVFEPVDDGELFRSQIAPTTMEPGEQIPTPQLISAAYSMAEHAFTTGNVVVSPDLVEEKRFDDAFLRDQGVRAALMLPLWVADEPVCLLGVFRCRPQEFMLDEVWYLERIADSLASLVEVAGRPADDRPPVPIGKADERLRVLEQLETQLNAAAANERLLAASMGSSPEDFRVSQRHEYPYNQMIAPIHDDRMPTWDDFVKVPCGDLSGGGISLWLGEKPNFRELVVALGRPPSVMHFAARVVYAREGRRAGRMMYQVGCQFLRRVYL